MASYKGGAMRQGPYELWQIGGTLEVLDGGKVVGLNASATRPGLVRRAVNVPGVAEGGDAAATVNALLDALKRAGIMVADAKGGDK